MFFFNCGKFFSKFFQNRAPISPKHIQKKNPLDCGYNSSKIDPGTFPNMIFFFPNSFNILPEPLLKKWSFLFIVANSFQSLLKWCRFFFLLTNFSKFCKVSVFQKLCPKAPKMIKPLSNIFKLFQNRSPKQWYIPFIVVKSFPISSKIQPELSLKVIFYFSYGKVSSKFFLALYCGYIFSKFFQN